MRCFDIKDIEFSPMSVRAIKEIRRIKKLSTYLIAVTGTGHLATIFLGNGPIQASYSLYSTDFQLMTRAMAGVPAITRRLISDVAARTYLRSTDLKERQFWRTVYTGCRID